jgi:hypothetical protein
MSKEPKRKPEIEIEHLPTEMEELTEEQAAAAQGGASSGQVSLSEFTIKKTTNTASPGL